jgi:hypothetical protein
VVVSSPNEPGQPGWGDRPAGADGSTDAPPWPNSGTDVPPWPNSGTDAPPWPNSGTDAPPWQSGARRTDGAPAHAAAEQPARSAPPAAAPAGDPRASRYVTGVAAPDLSSFGSVPQRPDPEPPAPERLETRTERIERAEIVPVEAYPSELPDLSAPAPRPPVQRRPPAPPARPAGPGSRIGMAGQPRGPVRASMQIRRIDPWSTLKVSGLLSVALFFVWMIAVAFLYLVLGAMGVWSKLNSNVGDLLTSGSGGGGDIVSAGSIFGGAALVGLVNIVLLTALATVGAYIYNLSTDIVGGVEVTLADLD